MQHIARLLDIPGQSGPPSPAFLGAGVYSPRTTGRGSRENRPLFHTGRVAEFTPAPRRENLSGVIHRTDAERRRRERESPNRALAIRKDSSCSSGSSSGKREQQSRDSSGNRTRSREGSPRMPRPRSEEIPLELIKKSPATSVIENKITVSTRPQTPRNEIINEQIAIAPTETTTQNNTTSNSVIASEETSFIAQDSNGAAAVMKKGSIETV